MHRTATATSKPSAREQAEVNEIVTALRARGVLTLVELRECCWADRWPERDFVTAPRRALASGQIRHLGDERYAIAEPPQLQSP